MDMTSWYLCIVCVCCILFYELYLQPTHVTLNFGSENCLLNLFYNTNTLTY